jgi:hypothetical protein
MKTIVEISQFINPRLQVKTIGENRQQREKKGERERERWRKE